MTVAVRAGWPSGLRPGTSSRRSYTEAASYALTVLSLAFLLAIVGLFAVQSLPIWARSGLGYLTGARWFYPAAEFGALPMLYGTAVVSLGALALAAPVGLGAAIFLAEYLPPRSRLLVKIAIEMLAAVPSVVYGLLGVLLLRNYVYGALSALGLEPLSGDSLLTAAVLLAVMILPTLITLADDALRAVPGRYRQIARALGLTRAQMIGAVSLREARSGLIAAVLLALGRALGETIAVFLVVGRQDNQLPANPLSLAPLIGAGQTLTSKLGGAETPIAYGEPLHWAAVVGLGMLLLLIVLAITLAGARLGQGTPRDA